MNDKERLAYDMGFLAGVEYAASKMGDVYRDELFNMVARMEKAAAKVEEGKKE